MPDVPYGAGFASKTLGKIFTLLEGGLALTFLICTAIDSKFVLLAYAADIADMRAVSCADTRHGGQHLDANIVWSKAVLVADVATPRASLLAGTMGDILDWSTKRVNKLLFAIGLATGAGNCRYLQIPTCTCRSRIHLQVAGVWVPKA